MRTPLCLLCLLVGLFSLPARAQDFIGTRALSLSEAYRAVATGNDAIYMNPAGLVLVPRYSPELHYNFNLIEEQQQFDVSVVDSKTSAFAAGLGYTFQGSEFTRRVTLQHAATLALAYPIFPKIFSVGAGLKYVNVSDAFVGNYLNALTADLGLLLNVPGGVSFAAVGYNLIPIQRSSHVPISAAFAFAWDLGPASALIFGGMPSLGMIPNAAGTSVQGDPATLRGPLGGLTWTGDWYVDFFHISGAPKSRLSTGLEYLAFDMVPLRAGYMWDEEAEAHLVSVGAGFIVPFFGLDVAYQQSIWAEGLFEPPLQASKTFSLSLKFFLDL